MQIKKCATMPFLYFTDETSKAEELKTINIHLGRL